MATDVAEGSAQPTAPQATGSAALSSMVFGAVNQEDIQFSMSYQDAALEKLKGSTAKLRAFNDSSADDLARMGQELERSARVCVQMKRDLEDIFRRLRGIQRTLQQQYPQYAAEAAKAVEENARAKGRSLDDEDEDDEAAAAAAAKAETKDEKGDKESKTEESKEETPAQQQ